MNPVQEEILAELRQSPHPLTDHAIIARSTFYVQEVRKALEELVRDGKVETILAKDGGLALYKLVSPDTLRHLKHADELLGQIAAGLRKLPGEPGLFEIEVMFRVEGRVYNFSLPQALETLAGDWYWDERGNWEDCRVAEVTTVPINHGHFTMMI